jgi:hypothetical protein
MSALNQTYGDTKSLIQEKLNSDTGSKLTGASFAVFQAYGAVGQTRELVSMYKKGNKMLQIQDGGKIAREFQNASIKATQDEARKLGKRVPNSLELKLKNFFTISSKDASKIDAKLSKLDKNVSKTISTVEAITARSALKDAGKSVIVAAGIGSGLSLLSTGTISQQSAIELGYNISGVAAAEIAEQSIKKLIEKKGISVATKIAEKTAITASTKATTKVGTTLVKSAATSMAKKFAMAATGVGIAFAAIDVLNAVLDLVDPCKYNSSEQYQKDLTKTYNVYLQAYVDAYKEAKQAYPSEVEPIYFVYKKDAQGVDTADLDDENQAEFDGYVNEYLNKCNLKMPTSLDTKLQKKQIRDILSRRRNILFDSRTNKIIYKPSVLGASEVIEDSDIVDNLDSGYKASLLNTGDYSYAIQRPPLVLSTVLLQKAEEEGKIRQTKRKITYVKLALYIAILILIYIAWFYYLFN